MINFGIQDILRDAEPAAAGGGSNTPVFDSVAFEKKMMDSLQAGINGLSKQIKLMAKPQADPTPEPVISTDPTDPATPKPDAALKAMERKLYDLTAKLENSDKQRLEVETRAKQERLNSTLKDGLLAAGVDPKRITPAMRNFLGDLKYDDAGNIVAGNDELPIGEFIAAQLKTDEGAIFLPPKQVNGSGASNGTNNVGRIDIDWNKPGMLTPAEQVAASAQVAEYLKSSG